MTNTTPRMRNAAVGVLCARLLEMINGVGPGFPEGFVRHVLQRFGEHPRFAEFMSTHGAVIRHILGL
jgi:hypothetical protein